MLALFGHANMTKKAIECPLDTQWLNSFIGQVYLANGHIEWDVFKFNCVL